MKYNSRITLISVFIFILGLCCSPGREEISRDFSKRDAEELLSSYVKTFVEEDSTALLKYWSTISSEKESFRMMLFYFGGIGPYSYWKNFLGSYTYEIDGIDHGESFHIINMRWVRKSSAEDENIPERRMRFYITQESEKWVFVNPVDAITSKWKIHSTDRIVFIYPPGVNIGDYRKEIEYLVEETENFIELFDLDKSIEITYFYAQSQREASEFFLQRPSNGYAVPWMNAAVSVTFDNYHEVIHTLHYGLEWNSGVNAFDEGLPVAFAGNTKTTAGMALIESRNFIRDNKFIPLSELLTNSREFFAKNYITYHESGAFVKFLIENYGAERLKSLCIYTRSSKDVFTSFKEIYGTTPEDLEESFKEYLMEVRVPEIETVVPENSDLIFSMTDPTGDDNGDGDYTYPNERFREGVFDLRKFEVLKDEINVYFRILFADMTEPVTYGSGGELFMPGAVIAINKGGNEDRPLRKYGDGVEFGEDGGYDLKINIGYAVSLTNPLGRIYFTSPSIGQKMRKIGDNIIEFSLPVEYLGEPDKDWKYCVGIGLMSDRSMNFIDAGLTPVIKEGPPVFIKGGNYNYGNPAFIDLLLGAEFDQAEILGNYDPTEGKRAVVPMVGPKNKKDSR